MDMKLFALLVGYVQSVVSKVSNAVKSVNGKTGEVTLTATDVGAAITARGLPTGGSIGQILTKNGSGNYACDWENICDSSEGNGWVVRKWSDGIAEAYYTSTGLVEFACTTAVGGIYESTAGTHVVNFPSSLFIAKPSLIISGTSNNSRYINIKHYGVENTNSVDLVGVSAQSASFIIDYSIYAIGKWK